MKQNQLKKDLSASSAKQKDIQKMMGVVETLQSTQLPSLSDATRHKIEAIPGNKSRAPLFTFVSLGSAFAVFLVMVFAAQFALPGSPLYGIKRGTEYIRALIQPSYKEDLVEVRKQELDTLEKEQAPENLIDKAVTEYEKAGGTPESTPQQQEEKTDDDDRSDRDNRRNRDNGDPRNNRQGSDARNSRNSDSRENNWSWQ